MWHSTFYYYYLLLLLLTAAFNDTIIYSSINSCIKCLSKRSAAEAWRSDVIFPPGFRTTTQKKRHCSVWAAAIQFLFNLIALLRYSLLAHDAPLITNTTENGLFRQNITTPFNHTISTTRFNHTITTTRFLSPTPSHGSHNLPSDITRRLPLLSHLPNRSRPSSRPILPPTSRTTRTLDRNRRQPLLTPRKPRQLLRPQE